MTRSVCGQANPSHARFCLGCGAPMTPAAARGSSPDPRSYTPRHLADKILTTRAALEGERKQAMGSASPRRPHRKSA